jgi:dihydroneopterin aldolase
MGADDRIELRGLRLMGTHGVLPEERTRAQPFEVDLDIVADLAAAAASDDVRDTVDYGAVTDLVARIVGTESFHLLEALADRIAEVVLEDVRVGEVAVTVRKLRPPVPVPMATAGVRVRRVRRGS